MSDSQDRRGRPPAPGLTPAQRRALLAVERFLATQRFPPTAQELGAGLGIAAASAHELIGQLVQKGYLAREPGKARSLRVLRNSGPVSPAVLVAVPILGKVVAGRPVDAPEDADGEVLVDAELVRGGKHFALRVKGLSMAGARMADGDIVVVRQQPIAENGDIVVASLDGETTVKRLAIDGPRIELRPEHPKFKPIRVAPDADFRVLGKVVAVRREAED
jgi:repressor LexA